MQKSLQDILKGNRSLLLGLASNYIGLFLVDLESLEFETIKASPFVQERIPRGIDWGNLTRITIPEYIAPRHIAMYREYTDATTLALRLSNTDVVSKVVMNTMIPHAQCVSLQWLIAERDPSGKATRAFFTITKVDEKQRVDQQLMKDVSDITNTANMGIWRIEIFDDELPRMQVTPKMKQLMGLDLNTEYSEERTYEEWHSRIYPDALESVNTSVQKMIDGQQDENTYRWKHPTLGERYVRCGGLAHRVPGKGYSLVGYHYDVTEAVRSEKEQNNIVMSLANTFECLFLVDVKNNSYTSFNNTIPSVQKYISDQGSLDDSFEKFAQYLCTPEFSEKIRAFTDMSTIDNRMRTKKTISTQFKGLTVGWTEVAFHVCERDENSIITKLIMSIKNINEQKIAEQKQMEELKASIEANKFKTEMLQNMTHELRTPLNAMFGFSQLLSLPDGSFTGEEKEEFFNYIYNGFNMLSMHIDDVLDLADAEHGNYRINIGEVNVNDVCRRALQMVEPRRQASVTTSFTTDVPDDYVIQSDERRIQQVLINYLTNACKHTVKGKILLHLSTTETPGRLTFSVTDTGAGIPAEMQQDIFQRYKKANAMVQGSGLGLNICSIIAEKLNGEVKLDTSYTNGARFLFIL